ncbi:GNAT family N-acetyltransferase [Nocardia brevicatena]|uniref:GNAT family N-acetyltransferase n=1 Tax=Nocardia brevicatena TaxID=37327 RepID=UPI0002EFE652|nr:GNAT family N-acetyltransferase [Nocardia brevicatena]
MEERTLTDGTVWLSRPKDTDIDVITEHCQDPVIGEWVTIPVPYRRCDAEGFVHDMVANGWVERSPVWGVRLAEHGRLIGTVGLGARDESAAEIGYWLAPEYRRRGLIGRAVGMVCDFGFRTDGLALARISWRAFVGNHASAAVVRNNGFRYEGLCRLGSLQRGVRRDHWMAARLSTDPPGRAEGWPADI